ncbi:hypothetical protein BAE44_0024957 [Dichanthelium oligosanthes]|uniref:FAR1 domain-containing protein n=1 Tax=Dichanthelium oligosanthes TaxID=888268 RepID=A0A1E5UMB2_9POAL|nr:hypothetical protein BAE44_0024957 [Dichanthelium oligosanthes]
MEFESEDAARDFYSTYARSAGFRIRISRVGCKAMIMIKKFGPGKWMVTKFVKNHNHGPVPPRKLDSRPANQDCDPMEKSHSIEVEPVEEPFEGMEFESEEAAKSFYIVCSKEGFREVRTKKVMMDEGKTKRPRMITRVGCKAMIVVKKMNSGKWMVSKFEKEHNHSLSYSKMVPITSNITSGEVADFAAKSADPLDEAIKFAKEGSVTEEIYHVAVSALKEAAEKAKTMSALQCSDQVELKTASPGSWPLQESASNLLLVPTNILADSRSYNRVDNVPLSSDLPTNGRQSRQATEGSFMHFENIKETSSQKSQKASSNQAIHGKDEGIHEPSEETMVAIPAIPLSLCMPVMQNLPGSSSDPVSLICLENIGLRLIEDVQWKLAPSDAYSFSWTADGPYRLLAAPIEAVPISYRPAEPIRQPQKGVCALGPFAGVLSELNKRGTGPNSLVHATALACGARAVPLEEAASLINAIESKIRSGGAIIAKLP